MVAGSALIYTLTVQGGPAEWIGYQLLTGIGYGIGFPVPFIAVQVVLEADDIPTGNVLTIFLQARGCALTCSIAQNIFSGTQMSSTDSGVSFIQVYTPSVQLPFSGYNVQHLVNDYKFRITPCTCVTLSC